MTSLRVAVVCGGPSAEAAVSRSSGRMVAQALRRSFPDVTVVELDSRIADALKSARPDVVFPVLHGPLGEDGSFQGMLEVLGLAYVGSGVAASACAMDKVVAKAIFRSCGLTVAPGVVVSRGDDLEAAACRAQEKVGSDLVIKPVSQGSALGVSFAVNRKQLLAGLREALRFGSRAMAERRVRGREITVGVLERGRLEVLPAVEVRTPKGSWYDFRHRYTEGLSTHVIPAPLPRRVYQKVQAMALAAHQALGCRDLSRADFVVPQRGSPVLLEVNTMPGMTPTSLFPDAARAAGISFEELVEGLVMRAWGRNVGRVSHTQRRRPTWHG